MPRKKPTPPAPRTCYLVASVWGKQTEATLHQILLLFEVRADSRDEALRLSDVLCELELANQQMAHYKRTMHNLCTVEVMLESR